MSLSQKRFKPSTHFLMVLSGLLLIAIGGKPTVQWVRAAYDAYKVRTTVLVASDTEYHHLLTMIQAQQPGQRLNQPVPAELVIPEQIFQAAIAPNLLGRNSRYEPNTSHGKLACAWMVNMVFQNALNYRVGDNPAYVPSVVEALDKGIGHRIEQSQTQRGDIAIANGTDYQHGLWHIGICMTPQCTLVLSNSPFTSRFEWLSDATFDGAFAHYPGKTTFYRITKRNL